MQELTQEYLKECLDYDPETGIFVWKERPFHHFKNLRSFNSSNAIFNNKKAGSKNNRGYFHIQLLGKKFKSHRLVWLYVYGFMPKNEIDHINGIKTDNRLCNLREATRSENMQNQKIAHINNKSTELLGSYKVKTRFKSKININKKQIILGVFETSQEAHEAYLKAKREMHPYNTL